MISILDPKEEISALKPKFIEAFERVLDSGQFILGKEVKSLEEELCQYLNVPYCITVNSGTDALLIALKAMGVGKGDEVITSSFTFFATAEAICLAGATPVLVDIDPKDFCIDVSKIEQKISNKTKAIIPVHLFGNSCNMDEICALAKKYKLSVIEDTAQAFGAKWNKQHLGTFGNMGAFSFYPTKNLGGYGDGGFLCTFDENLAKLSKMLRHHGSEDKYDNKMLGFNSRLDEIQAALLRVKLPYVDGQNLKRRQAAKRYDELLTGLSELTVPKEKPESYHVFNQYTVRIEKKRDEVYKKLTEKNIYCQIYYPKPLHKLSVFSFIQDAFLMAEKTSAEVLSLPLWPDISIETQLEVARSLKEVL